MKYGSKAEGTQKLMKYSFDTLLPCVIKKLVFDRQVCVATNERNLCTISEEVFVLLLLETSFDGWLDIYQLRKGEVTPKRGQKLRKFESDVPTSGYLLGYHDAIWHPRARIQDIINIYTHLNI
jgi:hypothetical protein